MSTGPSQTPEKQALASYVASMKILSIPKRSNKELQSWASECRVKDVTILNFFGTCWKRREQHGGRKWEIRNLYEFDENLKQEAGLRRDRGSQRQGGLGHSSTCGETVRSLLQVWVRLSRSVLVGKLSIFVLHGWVKLLLLGHSINHLLSKDQSSSQDPHFTSGTGKPGFYSLKHFI